MTDEVGFRCTSRQMERTLLLAVVGIVLAIGIPSWLRWRIEASEKAALADVRSLQQAMAGYEDANGGFYEGRLACLMSPGCIPNRVLPPAGLLDASFASTDSRHKYRFTFVPGAPPSRLPAASSPTSVTSYCYSAAPVKQSYESEVRRRSFAVDDTGRACVDSEPIECVQGRLPLDCTPLE